MGRFVAAHASCVSARTAPIDRVVMHVAEGSATGTIAWFQMGTLQRAKANLSRKGHSPTEDQIVAEAARVVPTATHFVISEEGETTQMVLESQRCLHAGNRAWNHRSIGIELEGYTRIGHFPDPMLRAAAVLVADICKRRNIPVDREHIVGHSEVPGATHTDPGAHFAWDYFMELVKAT